MAKAVEDSVADFHNSASAAATAAAVKSATKAGKEEYAKLTAEEKKAALLAQPPMHAVGKEVIAIKAFARALRAIPAILADNAGYDSNELVAQLETAHAAGVSTAGLDMDKGCIGDMVDLKITEPLKLKMQVLISAHEAAEMILRVDEIIKCAPRRRAERGHGGHGH